MTNRLLALAVLSTGIGAGAALHAQAPATPPPPMPPVLQNYKPVTEERLLHPEDSDVLMVRRTYDGWGYSPLKQITPANVARLKPVWSFATGNTSGHEATPLVNNGVMFVATPGNQVLAIDAKTGLLLWRYLNTPPPDVINLHRTSRGVALLGNKVFFARSEAVLVALDAKTGKELWATEVEKNRNGYYISMAPLVADGKVIVGTSGGELGVRGFVAAFDPETGKQLWKVFTIPAPGEPGSETWPAGGDQWKTGGGSIWVTANYDPATKLAYFGTGNGGPWMGDRRPGDNLYTSSTIAIDVTTGTIKGHHQYDPNESWDWDEVSPPILVDFKRGDRTIKGLIDIARDGYMWFLERTNGRINFVDAKPFVKQNVFRSVDPKTGRPDVDPARKPGTGKRAEFCPSFWGGKNWPPIAYNPETRFIYIPANENLCSAITGREVPYQAGTSFVGATSELMIAPGADHIGEVQAWNVDTGAKVWTHTFANSPNWGPMLTTGWRPRVLRRHQRPQVPRVRRKDRSGAVGVSDQLRHHRPAVHLHGRRRAVRRRAVRLGRRLALDARPPERAPSRAVP
ncbi:MAG: PQQ-binding-like beta-propeller repeat protein [Vicinamibacterales bacterium]